MVDQVLMEACRDENFCGLVRSATIDELDSFEKHVKDTHYNCKDLINSNGLTHEVVNGMYRRTLMMPRGAIISGSLHRYPYFDTMISGRAFVKSFLVDGSVEEGKELIGFNSLQGRPGRKRLLYILEDTLWQTVERTTKETPEEAAEELLVDFLDDWEEDGLICQA